MVHSVKELGYSIVHVRQVKGTTVFKEVGYFMEPVRPVKMSSGLLNSVTLWSR